MVDESTEGTAPQPTRVDDPHSLRALSHPVRLRLLADLAARSPQNVKMLAERAGEPANSVSYHLSQLVAHGLVERVDGPEGATRRERWFASASPTGFTLVLGDEGPDAMATQAAMKAWMLQMTSDMFDRYTANEPEARRRGLPIGTATTNLWLTEQEAVELGREIEALQARLARRVATQRDAADPSAHPGEVHYTVDLGWFPDFSDEPMTGHIWSSEGADHASPDEG